MAATGKKFWASEPVAGPSGKFHVEVERLAPGQHPLGRRDLYTATLYRKGEQGNEAVETAFWQHTSPPHDADKFIFRDKARKAAGEPAAAEAQ
jgi:hypothetical protein